ncbi:WS/DGAT domain-containing protein [Zhongshania sp. BJYM1]|uniref:WS/DGAT domain-containing protein n=1 Tax=Zhongshania aquatica TaxID=2965069 RepID=UPI0022B3E306|nr:WS/DGAT domain-containing protein [Marortus sp. BJYM1]
MNTISVNFPVAPDVAMPEPLQAIFFYATALGALGVFIYCGTVAITVLSDRKVMPDPEFYEQCLRDSYQELISACSVKRKAPSSAKRKTSDH